MKPLSKKHLTIACATINDVIINGSSTKAVPSHRTSGVVEWVIGIHSKFLLEWKP